MAVAIFRLFLPPLNKSSVLDVGKCLNWNAKTFRFFLSLLNDSVWSKISYFNV